VSGEEAVVSAQCKDYANSAVSHYRGKYVTVVNAVPLLKSFGDQSSAVSWFRVELVFIDPLSRDEIEACFDEDDDPSARVEEGLDFFSFGSQPVLGVRTLLSIGVGGRFIDQGGSLENRHPLWRRSTDCVTCGHQRDKF
jgi:hypothetical protein